MKPYFIIIAVTIYLIVWNSCIMSVMQIYSSLFVPFIMAFLFEK